MLALDAKGVPDRHLAVLAPGSQCPVFGDTLNDPVELHQKLNLFSSLHINVKQPAYSMSQRKFLFVASFDVLDIVLLF